MIIYNEDVLWTCFFAPKLCQGLENINVIIFTSYEKSFQLLTVNAATIYFNTFLQPTSTSEAKTSDQVETSLVQLSSKFLEFNTTINMYSILLFLCGLHYARWLLNADTDFTCRAHHDFHLKNNIYNNQDKWETFQFSNNYKSFV